MSTVANPGGSPPSGPLDRLRPRLGGKSIWDWLDLIAKLAIPIVVLGATILFGWWQVHLADLQHQSDQKLAQQQHEADQQNVLDQQRQATLVTYLDNMRDLLLNRGLLTSKPGDEIRVIARTETLSAIRQLDWKRNRFLVQFLWDAHLIGFDFTTGKVHDIVNFEYADLSSTDLSYANLSDAHLIGAQLSHATLYRTELYYAELNSADLTNATLVDAFLYGAQLKGADLERATLSYADLDRADLDRATLSYADLNGAHLGYADLRNADLSGADLSHATLTNAVLTNAVLTNAYYLTQQQLDQVYTCKGATLPPGLTCHHNLTIP